MSAAAIHIVALPVQAHCSQAAAAGVVRGVPPSALPGISPTRGEIDQRRTSHQTVSVERAAAVSVARGVPPSVLPDISPTGGEIGWAHPLALPSLFSAALPTRRSPPLWGRCPAGQRGVSP